MESPLTKLRRFRERMTQINEILRRVDDLQKAVGRLELRMSMPREQARGQWLWQYEFKVFSQWGEDGVIQFLIHKIEIPNKVFVEFGIHDYRESNTRFLIENDNWRGLVMDSWADGIQIVKSDPLYYRHDLHAVTAFIDRESINDLLTANGINGDIGLLSIDIDGNDYWVWEAITCIQPRIVICEYNSLLGSTRSLVTPYDRSFDRRKAHYSLLYGGASVRALEALGKMKGYSLLGSTSAGNDLFFVRNDVVGALPVLSHEAAYVKARFRSSRDKEGNLTFLSFEEGQRLIADMPVVDLDRDRTIKVGETLSP
jgi:hypothetical protein